MAMFCDFGSQTAALASRTHLSPLIVFFHALPALNVHSVLSYERRVGPMVST